MPPASFRRAPPRVNNRTRGGPGRKSSADLVDSSWERATYDLPYTQLRRGAAEDRELTHELPDVVERMVQGDGDADSRRSPGHCGKLGNIRVKSSLHEPFGHGAG